MARPCHPAVGSHFAALPGPIGDDSHFVAHTSPHSSSPPFCFLPAATWRRIATLRHTPGHHRNGNTAWPHGGAGLHLASCPGPRGLAPTLQHTPSQPEASSHIAAPAQPLGGIEPFCGTPPATRRLAANLRHALGGWGLAATFWHMPGHRRLATNLRHTPAANWVPSHPRPCVYRKGASSFQVAGCVTQKRLAVHLE